MEGAHALHLLGILGALAPGTSTPLPFEFPAPRDYSGHSFVSVYPEDESVRKFVVDSASENPDCAILKTSRRSTDLFCGKVDALSRSLKTRGIKHEIVAASENRNMDLADRSSESGRDIDFSDYFSYEDEMRYLRKQADLHPDIVTLTKEGTTEEGRDIMLIKISDNSRADTADRKAVWIDAGIHAREWIAHYTGLYVVDRLIEAFSSPEDRLANGDVRDVDWFVMPLLNPDGYEYSRTTDRMWRKNRSKPKNRSSSSCRGVDLNRNYDTVGFGVGASDDPCSDSYKGETANSEPEVKAAYDVVMRNKDSIKASISLHSQGELLLTSWGYKTELPRDNDELIRIAGAAAAAIKAVNNRDYTVEPACGLYPAGGASDDFAKSSGVPFAVTVELPGGNDRSNPWGLDKSMIRGVGEEIWAATKVFASEAKNL